MKIILDIDQSIIADHAKRLIISREKYENTHPETMIPKGVPVHSARFPLICDDCGETYWMKEEYGQHLGCSGYKKQATGFKP